MTKFIMLVGLQGSGKSTISEQLTMGKNMVTLSSDAIREELYGERTQEHNNEVFQTMNNRTISYLEDGISVIYDATNVNSKRRKSLLNQLPKDVEKTCVYMMVDKKDCIERDRWREHKVGKEVIDNTYKNLQIPMYHEGWDDIILFLPRFRTYPNTLSDLLKRKPSILTMCDIMCELGLNPMNYDIDQENPYHKDTILEHTYKTYKYIHECYFGNNKEELIIASILHDIGKIECKEHSEKKKRCTYYNHEKVSAQIALEKLSAIYPNEKNIMISTIIELHMRLSHDGNEKADNRLRKLVGDEMYSMLKIFRLADKQR